MVKIHLEDIYVKGKVVLAHPLQSMVVKHNFSHTSTVKAEIKYSSQNNTPLEDPVYYLSNKSSDKKSYDPLYS